MQKHKTRAQPKRDNERTVSAAVLTCLGREGLRVLAAYDSNQADVLRLNPGIHKLLEDHRDPHSFAEAYQAWSFLSKDPSLKTGIDTRAAAFASFDAAEAQCRDTNHRLRSGYDGNVAAVREQAYKLLGSLSERDLELVLSSASWGPGVTSACKGKTTSKADKLKSDLHATPALIEYLAPAVVGRDPLWGMFVLDADGACSPLKSTFIPRNWNTLTNVPKNAKTDRMIAVEPHVNVAVQLAVAKLLRRRLRRHDIDLSTQEVNQRLAREGSLTGGFATIDMKAASDTVALEVVRAVLPPAWFKLLDVCRSPWYQDPRTGGLRPYAKFSSMGNGSTFELETLLFSCAARTAIEQSASPETRYSVFGDDVVLPTPAVERFLELLSSLGFTVNVEKSFTVGPFRESCGCDYYNGVPVRPFFKRGSAECPEVLYLLANQIRQRACAGGLVDPQLFPAWQTIVRTIPRELRFKVPSCAGELAGIWSTLDEAMGHPSVHWDRQVQQWSFRTRCFKPKERRFKVAFQDGFLCESKLITSQLARLLLQRSAGSWERLKGGSAPLPLVKAEDHESTPTRGLPLREVGSWGTMKVVSAWHTTVQPWH